MKMSTLHSEVTGFTYALTLSDDRRSCGVAWAHPGAIKPLSSTVELSAKGHVKGDAESSTVPFSDFGRLSYAIETLVLCELRDRAGEFALLKTMGTDPPREVFSAATAYLISQGITDPMVLPTVAFRAFEAVAEIRNRVPGST